MSERYRGRSSPPEGEPILRKILKHHYTPPARYITGKEDFCYRGNQEICDFYTDYLEEHVDRAGYWELNWTWAQTPMPEKVVLDWRGKLIVDHMLFIERMVK